MEGYKRADKKSRLNYSMMNSTRLFSLSIGLLLLSPGVRAAVIFGSTSYTPGSGNQVTDVTTLNINDLSGNDQLVINYSVTRGNDTLGDSWVTVAFNTDPSFFAFTSSGVFGGLLRTRTSSTNPHEAFRTAEGSWDPNNSSVGITVATGHAVRITLSGLGTGGFTGKKDIIFEIDHDASTFGSADRTFTGTIDFGDVDLGLKIDLRTLATGFDPEYSINNFTITAIPEPSIALLAGGVLRMAFARRRRLA